MPQTPFPRSYWVQSPNLLAGSYPGDLDQTTHNQKLEALEEAGIKHVCNLMEPHETSHNDIPFRGYIEELAVKGISTVQWGVQDGGIPTTAVMKQILDDIDLHLSIDEPVYVHCWGGRGRTGTVICCWLIRHGLVPEKALEWIQALRSNVPDANFPVPENQIQIHFVKEWTEMKLSQNERIQGAIWGHLVGDALGVPYEFLDPEEITEVEFGVKGTHNQPPGTWSDDGGLMLALLDSNLKGFDTKDQGQKILAWGNEAAYMPGEVFDIGITTSSAINNLERGVPPEESGPSDDRSNGNGSLMRILPIALVYKDSSKEQLIEYAMKASKLTHGHPKSQLTCALYTLVVSQLLNGADKATSLENSTEYLSKYIERQKLSASYLDSWKAILTYPEKTGSGYVIDSFCSAWASFETSNNYADTVRKAVFYGNDTDTTACIAGGLAGAYWGFSSIPKEWVDKMRGKDIVQELLVKLDRKLETSETTL